MRASRENRTPLWNLEGSCLTNRPGPRDNGEHRAPATAHRSLAGSGRESDPDSHLVAHGSVDLRVWRLRTARSTVELMGQEHMTCFFECTEDYLHIFLYFFHRMFLSARDNSGITIEGCYDHDYNDFRQYDRFEAELIVHARSSIRIQNKRGQIRQLISFFDDRFS